MPPSYNSRHPYAMDIEYRQRHTTISDIKELLEKLGDSYLIPQHMYEERLDPLDQSERNALAAYLRGAIRLRAEGIFTRGHFQDNHIRHCARCHSDYDQRSNTEESCRVPHVYQSQITYPPGAFPYYKALCCEDHAFYHDICDKPYKDSDCYVGQHTEQKCSLNYNRANIVPCSQDNVNGSCLGYASDLSVYDGNKTEFPGPFFEADFKMRGSVHEDP